MRGLTSYFVTIIVLNALFAVGLAAVDVDFRIQVGMVLCALGGLVAETVISREGRRF